MNRLSRYQLGIVASMMLFIGGLIGGNAMQAGRAPEAAIEAATPPVLSAATMPTTFSPIVKSVMPAVVNISSSRVVQRTKFDAQNPFEDLFPGLRAPQRPQRQNALGSGVIISPDGYVLTNSHVVDGATEVTVSLSDKREMRARIVGTDAKTDIALMKLDAKNLPYVKLGTSASVEVGDIALAMGNPFGLGQTVTMGIVSAVGRGGLGIEDYEDFIQTDASINPGNSGGALVDVRGELIGINTAILSGSGGNQGIGFAVPIDMVRNVMTQLRERGSVTRAWLGIQMVSDRENDERGVVVESVEPNGPAAKAGIQPNDVILSLDGKDVDERTLRLMTASQIPGTTVSLRLMRNGRERTVDVNLGTMPGQDRAANENPLSGRGRRR
jgi:serine protease Do